MVNNKKKERKGAVGPTVSSKDTTLRTSKLPTTSLGNQASNMGIWGTPRTLTTVWYEDLGKQGWMTWARHVGKT